MNKIKGKNEFHEYICKASIELDDVTTELICDTETYPINTTLQDIHLSSGYSMNNNVITIKMKNWRSILMDIDSIAEGKSIRKFHAKSGGLSKGAIAGIIIAAIVVVIAGVLVIILIFRKKPAPAPEGNNNNSSVNKFESTDKI